MADPGHVEHFIVYLLRDLVPTRVQGWSIRDAQSKWRVGAGPVTADAVREATGDEVKDLRSENRELKEVVAEITLRNRILKKV